MNCEELKKVANALVAPGKGILASDEPITYMDGRFQSIDQQNTIEMRRKYRQLLFTTNSIGNYISGVILLPETIQQQTDDGIPFPKLLKQIGVLTGVNVDKGLIDFNNETTTEGLDGLGKRCEEYRKAGCVFAKWRASFQIDQNRPSLLAIEENCRLLARYAKICQLNDLVPIIEPDISRDGTLSIDQFQKVTENVMSFVYFTLQGHGVYLEGTILKTNMVAHGFSSPKKASGTQIGSKTIEALTRTVPGAVPGIGFLSGGQSAKEATDNLKAICEHHAICKWNLTFIFGRALQEGVMEIWSANDSNTNKAQGCFLKLIKANSQVLINQS